MRLMMLFVAGAALCFLLTPDSQAQTSDPRFYDFGNPSVKDIWVDAVNGNDANSGESRDEALRSLNAAWRRIPRGAVLTGTGYRIKLAAGIYDKNAIPGYFELRYGTPQFPVIIQSADGRGAAVIAAFMNIFDCSYLYLLDLKIAPEPAETALHFEQCDHVVMRGLVMDGKHVAPQVLKVNHCDYIYLEDSEVSGASGSTVDFVATRNGRIIANRVHDAGNWGVMVKGGSAYFHVEANEIYNAVRGGFTAGQTTGFEFLQSPWLHYEAYDMKFINNVVHDTGNGGMAVNGGYNILFAYNTLYHLGGDGSMFEVLHGIRVCSEDTAKCAKYQADGGWGTAASDAEPIPNRNIFVYNNVLYNPPGFETRSSHFALFGPRTPSADSNIPSPAELDRNLRIRGNIIWNGGKDKPLGTEFNGVGCQPSNPTCNAEQLRADNAINTFEPQLMDPANGDFRPAPVGNLFGAKTYAIPNFDWSDAPSRPLAPAGNPENAVSLDRASAPRDASSPPGAYTLPAAPVLFSAAAGGKGLAAASVLRIRADGTQKLEPVARFDPAQNQVVAVPIDFGDAADQLFLILYGTGFRNRSALTAVKVNIGGVDSQVVFAGAQGQFAGLDQANVQLARGLAGRGEVDVELTVDGRKANVVRIHFK